MIGASRLSWNARPLRTLEAVARLGSVSAAAVELGYTQSAASQQLAALEREAGVSLIERGVRPLRPTPAGALVLGHARAVLEGFVAMESVLGEIHGVARGAVRLAAFGSALASVVPPVLSEFAAQRPGVEIEIAVAEPDAAMAALRAGAADLAVMHRTAEPPPDDGLRHRPLMRDPLLVVLPAKHPLARRRRVPLRALDGVPLVAPSAERAGRPHRLLVDRLLRGAGVEPRVAYEVDDLASAQALARAGLAAVLMHRLTIPDPSPGLALRPLADAAEGDRTIEVATLAARRWPPADALAALLVERLADP
jgi:DNA-binding transcriptional LysR family regulator